MNLIQLLLGPVRELVKADGKEHFTFFVHLVIFLDHV